MQRKDIIEEHIKSRSVWQNKTTGKWCTKLGKDKHLIVRKNKEDLYNAIIEFYITEDKSFTSFSDIFTMWLKHMEEMKTHSLSTKNRYQNDYDKYIMLNHFVTLPIASITEQELLRFLKSIVATNENLTLKRFSGIKTITILHG